MIIYHVKHISNLSFIFTFFLSSSHSLLNHTCKSHQVFSTMHFTNYQRPLASVTKFSILKILQVIPFGFFLSENVGLTLFVNNFDIDKQTKFN